MSELRDRLEALATRGTRRGADDVLSAAQRDAQTGAADGSEADGVADHDLPLVTLEPGARRRRRRFGSFVASAGIAALVGVGALAITAMFGSGGAGSPEGAVRQLADAITHKDPLAAVDVLVPSEVRTLRETVKGATQRAADLRIVDEASKPLAGVDLSVDHLELTTEPLADGYAKVVVTSGEISASTHRAQLSDLLQKATRNSGDAQGKADLSKLAANADLPTFVVVVRHVGGWYVSPAYTALEYVREVNQYPAADFGSANPAELGAATPQDAVTDALHAWQAANWDRLLALAPPDELPLYDYRAMIDQSAAGTKVDFTIDHLSTTATESGDTAVVKLDASGTFGSDPVESWQVGGNCPSFASRFGASSSSSSSSSGGLSVGSSDSPATSVDNSPSFCLSGNLAGTVPFGLRLATQATPDETTGPISISVVRENGRWFVSPVTTVLGVVDATIRGIDQRTVYTLLNLAYELPPDGTITLDQPFSVAAATSYFSSRVYAFDGQAGQDVVGAASASSSAASYSSLSGEIFTADGDDVGYVEFGSYPSSVKLPRSGSYRLVLDAYGVPSAGTSLTLWDLANAPKSLRDKATSIGETCTSSGGFLGGSESCRSVSVTPTTSYTYGGSSAGSSAPNALNGVTATSTAAPTTTVP